MEKRMITTDVTEEDLPLEGNLRPQTLDEYIGQEKTKNTLKIYIEAALSVTSANYNFRNLTNLI